MPRAATTRPPRRRRGAARSKAICTTAWLRHEPRTTTCAARGCAPAYRPGRLPALRPLRRRPMRLPFRYLRRLRTGRHAPTRSRTRTTSCASRRAAAALEPHAMPPTEPDRPAHAPIRQCTNAPMRQCTHAPMRQCTNAPQLRLAEEREQGLRVALMRAQQEREQAVPERDAAPDSAKLRRRRGSSGRPSPRPKETPLSAAPPSQLPRAGGDACGGGGCAGFGGGGGGAGGGGGVEVDPNGASSSATSPSGSSSQSVVGPPSSPRTGEAEATIARLRRDNAELQRRCEQAETYGTRCTRLLAAHEERCKLLTSMNAKLEQIVRDGKTAAAAAASGVRGAPPPASQQLATPPPPAAAPPSPHPSHSPPPPPPPLC